MVMSLQYYLNIIFQREILKSSLTSLEIRTSIMQKHFKINNLSKLIIRLFYHL